MISHGSILLASVLISGLLAGCSGGGDSPVEGKTAGTGAAPLSGGASPAGAAPDDTAERKATVSDELTPEESAMVRRAEKEAEDAFDPATPETPAPAN